MTVCLLDANVLISLVVAEHEHHDRVSRWVQESKVTLAVCPIVEGALIRFLLRLGETQKTAVEVLRAVRDVPGVEFWPDSVSYLDVDLAGVIGHRQVTDAYLAGLAVAHQAKLVTLDNGLTLSHPGATVFVPLTDAIRPEDARPEPSGANDL